VLSRLNPFFLVKNRVEPAQPDFYEFAKIAPKFSKRHSSKNRVKPAQSNHFFWDETGRDGTGLAQPQKK